MHRSAILLGLAIFFSLGAAVLAHQPSHSHLRTRAPDSDKKSGFTETCKTYYSANTPHAVCNGDRDIMCRDGCTGGVVAQNCQLNSSSPLTTQTCSVAFSQTSQAAYLCNTPQGAYTCQGPQTGGVVCGNCISTPNGVLPSNATSPAATSGQSSNSTNEHESQDSSSNSFTTSLSATMTLSASICLFIAAALST